MAAGKSAVRDGVRLRDCEIGPVKLDKRFWQSFSSFKKRFECSNGRQPARTSLSFSELIIATYYGHVRKSGNYSYRCPKLSSFQAKKKLRHLFETVTLNILLLQNLLRIGSGSKATDMASGLSNSNHVF